MPVITTTGCPGSVTVGDPVSFVSNRPEGITWTAGPYWVDNATLNGLAYPEVNDDPNGGPFAFNPTITKPGDYCFNFQATGSDTLIYTAQCCFTATAAQSAYISCPSEPIPEGTSLSLALNGGLPLGATNQTYQLLSGPGTISSTSYSYPFPVAGTHTITILRCYDLPVSADKRTRLLANPDRPDGTNNGYGSVTGGTNYVFPQDADEFKTALNTSGSYICIEEKFAGQTWFFDSGSGHANNITVDGSAAPGFTISPDPSYVVTGGDYMFDMFAGDDNIIWHCVKLDGNFHGPSGTGLGAFNVRSTNIWFDHVEVTQFWDGGWEISRTGDLVTLSNIKMYNTDKGILGYDPDNTNSRVTIFNSDMQATQRNPYVTRGEWHVYNSYIDGASFGAMRAGRRLSQTPAFASGTAYIISENNVFGANNSPDDQDTFTGYVTGTIESVGDIVGTQNGNVINSTAPSLFTIPYNYSPIPASEVEAYVAANAGAIDKTNEATGTVCEEDTCTFTVEPVAACDCSGLPTLWPIQGTCGTSQLITYTMPAGATLFNGGTNITGGTLTNVTATSAVLTVACTGSGTNLSGVVQIRYTLNGESCACNTTVTVADPIITATCNDSLVTHTAVMNADGTATVTVFNQVGNGTVLINAEPATGAAVSVIGGGSGQVVTSTTTTTVNGVDSKVACYSVVCA